MSGPSCGFNQASICYNVVSSDNSLSETDCGWVLAPPASPSSQEYNEENNTLTYPSQSFLLRVAMDTTIYMNYPNEVKWIEKYDFLRILKLDASYTSTESIINDFYEQESGTFQAHFLDVLNFLDNDSIDSAFQRIEGMNPNSGIEVDYFEMIQRMIGFEAHPSKIKFPK